MACNHTPAEKWNMEPFERFSNKDNHTHVKYLTWKGSICFAGGVNSKQIVKNWGSQQCKQCCFVLSNACHWIGNSQHYLEVIPTHPTQFGQVSCKDWWRVIYCGPVCLIFASDVFVLPFAARLICILSLLLESTLFGFWLLGLLGPPPI